MAVGISIVVVEQETLEDQVMAVGQMKPPTIAACHTWIILTASLNALHRKVGAFGPSHRVSRAFIVNMRLSLVQSLIVIGCAAVPLIFKTGNPLLEAS